MLTTVITVLAGLASVAVASYESDPNAHFFLQAYDAASKQTFALSVCPNLINGQHVVCATAGSPKSGSAGDFSLLLPDPIPPHAAYSNHSEYGFIATNIDGQSYVLKNSSTPATNTEYSDIVYYNAFFGPNDAANSNNVGMLVAFEIGNGDLVDAYGNDHNYWLCTENYTTQPADFYSILVFPSWATVENHYYPHDCRLKVKIQYVALDGTVGH